MKRLSDGRVQMTMSHHLKRSKAKELRDRFQEGTKRLDLHSSYHVEKGLIGWKVVKRWFLHDTGKQILGRPKKR